MITKTIKTTHLKHCKNNCQFCKNKIETANYYIEQEILKYYLQDQQNKENEKSPLIPKNQDPESPKKNEYRHGLVDNNKLISQYFNTIKIDGDGNCAFRAILEALNISQIWHNTLRELAANAIEEKQWNLEILEALNIESPKQLADQTRKENSFVGEATIAALAEKLELTIAIYLKDTTKKWIKENFKEGQETIYLEYIQGNYPQLDMEGHYNAKIPKQNTRLLSTERVKLKLEQQKSNEQEKNIIITPKIKIK